MRIFLVITFLNLFYYGFSQTIIKEILHFQNDKIELLGELSYRKDTPPQPLVIFVPGSGPIDRNGNQEGGINANYIQQLSEKLNEKNIAFFRYDKRTANAKNYPYLKDIRFEDLVCDVEYIVHQFENDERFSGIVLVGHSQGSLVAILAAQEVKVSRLISLAGPSERLEKLLETQFKNTNPFLIPVLQKHFEELNKTDTIRQVNPMLQMLFAPQNQKFIASWNDYEPKEEITKLKMPILIINGTLDLQVSKENAEQLHQAQPNSELKIIPNMTHVLKYIEQPIYNLRTYTEPNFPISEELVKSIVQFIKS